MSNSDPQLRFDDRAPAAPVVTGRDGARERAFLDDVSRGRDEFVDDVLARLAAGAVEYQDSWQWCGIRTLLREAREEGADLAGWSVLALQAVDLDTRLSESQLQQLAATLTIVGRHAAIAHETLTRALQIIGGAS